MLYQIGVPLLCVKCDGRVFLDRVFSEKMHVELFCVECGKRWMLDKLANPLAEWVLKREELYQMRSMIKK